MGGGNVPPACRRWRWEGEPTASVGGGGGRGNVPPLCRRWRWEGERTASVGAGGGRGEPTASL